MTSTPEHNNNWSAILMPDQALYLVERASDSWLKVNFDLIYKAPNYQRMQGAFFVVVQPQIISNYQVSFLCGNLIFCTLW